MHWKKGWIFGKDSQIIFQTHQEMCCKIHRFQLNFQFLFLIKDYYRLYSFACDLTSKAKHQHLGLGIVQERPILNLDVIENTCKKKIKIRNPYQNHLIKNPVHPVEISTFNIKIIISSWIQKQSLNLIKNKTKKNSRSTQFWLWM